MVILSQTIGIKKNNCDWSKKKKKCFSEILIWFILFFLIEQKGENICNYLVLFWCMIIVGIWYLWLLLIELRSNKTFSKPNQNIIVSSFKSTWLSRKNVQNLNRNDHESSIEFGKMKKKIKTTKKRKIMLCERSRLRAFVKSQKQETEKNK